MTESEQDPQELAWLEAYRAGDIDALGKLVDHTRRPLLSFLYRMVRDTAEAEELFQETWFRALRSIDRFDDRKLMSWLFRIARNLVIDRSRKKRPEISMDHEDENNQTMQDKIPSPGLTPGMQVAGHDLGHRIQEAVTQLPPEQREVFLLRTEGQLSFKEIAALQETSINTALGRMQYALNRLRTILEPTYNEILMEGGSS